jgi:arylsulfatase A-like enzyme
MKGAVINRRDFLGGLAVGGILPLTVRSTSAQARRPNFVFILADDLGWGDLGVHGRSGLRTPNLDRLAQEGTDFTSFYVSGSVCSPSRAAFTTGRFPARDRIHGHLAEQELNARRAMPNWLAPNLPTVAKLLKGAGYVTAHIGKWHLGGGGENPATGAAGASVPRPDAYGFDAYRADALTNMSGGTAGSLWADRPRSSEVIADETIRFIEAHREKPFYVQAWLLDPHATLNPTPEQLSAYPGMKAPGGYPSPQQTYFSVVSDMDRHIGRILQRLDELGLRENTIIVFSSDNGPEEIEIANSRHSGVGSPGPFRGRKRSLYEGGIRTPFLVRGPGVPAGRVSDAVVAGVDWLPTVCGLAGVSMPEVVRQDIDGEDRAAVLRGTDAPRRRPLMWEWRFRVFGHVSNRSPQLAMRDGDYKLLINPDRSRLELYDLRRDPSELDNIADRSENAGRTRAMSEKLLAWSKTLPDGPRDPEAGRNDYPMPKPAATAGGKAEQ